MDNPKNIIWKMRVVIYLFCLLCLVSCHGKQEDDDYIETYHSGHLSDSVRKSLNGTYIYKYDNAINKVNRKVTVRIHWLNDSLFTFDFRIACNGMKEDSIIGIAKYDSTSYTATCKSTNRNNLLFNFSPGAPLGDLTIDGYYNVEMLPCDFFGMYNLIESENGTPVRKRNSNNEYE